MNTIVKDQDLAGESQEALAGETELLHGDDRDLVYYSDDSVDSTLQKLVDLLNIPDFSVNQLSVKRSLPGQKLKAHCFDFSPVEIPVTGRIQQECGPGSYEIWIRNEKKEIYKRLKLNVSREEAASHTGAQQSRGSRPVSDQQNRGGQGQQGGHDKELRRELSDLKSQISILQRGGAPADNGTGITHRDLIEAEERGYNRAKEAFDLQLSSVKENHETQMEMVKESKGTERYLDDDEEGEDEEAGAILRAFENILNPAVEAITPFAEGFRTQKETENIIARNNAGLPPKPEPEIEPEEGFDEEDMQKVVETVLNTLVSGAANNQDPVKHAEGIFSKFEPDFINSVLLAPNQLDILFGQQPQLIAFRPWFERVVTSLKHKLNGDEQKPATETKAGSGDEESSSVKKTRSTAQGDPKHKEGNKIEEKEKPERKTE